MSPLILCGPPGVGKTALCIALAYKALQQRATARFVSCTELIRTLTDSRKHQYWERALRRFLASHVLIIGEVFPEIRRGEPIRTSGPTGSERATPSRPTPSWRRSPLFRTSTCGRAACGAPIRRVRQRSATWCRWSRSWSGACT